MKKMLLLSLFLLVVLCLASCSSSNINKKSLKDLNYIVQAKEDKIFLSFFDEKGEHLKDIKFSQHKKGVFLPGVTEGPPALIVQDKPNELKIYLSVFNEERYETYVYNHSTQKIEKIKNTMDSNWNLYFGEKYIYNTVFKNGKTILQKTNYKNKNISKILLPYSNPEKIVSDDQTNTQYIIFNEENESILVEYKDGKKFKELNFGKTYIGDIEIYNDKVIVAKNKNRISKENFDPLKEIDIFNSDLSRENTIETEESPSMLKIKDDTLYVISNGNNTMLEEYNLKNLQLLKALKVGSENAIIWDFIVENNNIVINQNNALLYVNDDKVKTLEIDGDTKSSTISLLNK